MYFGVNAAVSAIVIGMLTFVQAYAAGASLGNAVKAGVIAGVSTYAFAKIGQYFRAQGNANSLVPDGDLNLTSFGGNELTGGQVAQQVALHGITGGVTAELQGGKFGHGFFSAGFAKGVMGAAGFNYDNQSAGDIAGRTAIAATVGGTVSEVTGGKFRNGAETAAIAHLMNQEASAIARGFGVSNWNQGRCPMSDCRSRGFTDEEGEAVVAGIEAVNKGSGIVADVATGVSLVCTACVPVSGPIAATASLFKYGTDAALGDFAGIGKSLTVDGIDLVVDQGLRKIPLIRNLPDKVRDNVITSIKAAPRTVYNIHNNARQISEQ
jgi:hypothetical protein